MLISIHIPIPSCGRQEQHTAIQQQASDAKAQNAIIQQQAADAKAQNSTIQQAANMVQFLLRKCQCEGAPSTGSMQQLTAHGQVCMEIISSILMPTWQPLGQLAVGVLL